jgi:cytoskeletal protein CcmA (bactofilin family)
MSDAKRTTPAKTLVEEGTQFKGSLTSKCPVEIKGRVEGDLVAPALTVSATGAVHGKVKVEQLVSEGEIAGEFDADVVTLSGVVKDSTVVRARSLEVKLSPPSGRLQVTFGECALEVGDMPTREGEVGKETSRDAGKEAKEAKEASAPMAKSERTSVPPPNGSAVS